MCGRGGGGVHTRLGQTIFENFDLSLFHSLNIIRNAFLFSFNKIFIQIYPFFYQIEGAHKLVTCKEHNNKKNLFILFFYINVIECSANRSSQTT